MKVLRFLQGRRGGKGGLESKDVITRQNLLICKEGTAQIDSSIRGLFPEVERLQKQKRRKDKSKRASSSHYHTNIPSFDQSRC